MPHICRLRSLRMIEMARHKPGRCMSPRFDLFRWSFRWTSDKTRRYKTGLLLFIWLSHSLKLNCCSWLTGIVRNGEGLSLRRRTSTSSFTISITFRRICSLISSCASKDFAIDGACNRSCYLRRLTPFPLFVMVSLSESESNAVITVYRKVIIDRGFFSTGLWLFSGWTCTCWCQLSSGNIIKSVFLEGAGC